MSGLVYGLNWATIQAKLAKLSRSSSSSIITPPSIVGVRGSANPSFNTINDKTIALSVLTDDTTIGVDVSGGSNPDFDKDGIPDAFENHFTEGSNFVYYIPDSHLDADGDSLTNLEEWNNYKALYAAGDNDDVSLYLPEAIYDLIYSAPSNYDHFSSSPSISGLTRYDNLDIKFYNENGSIYLINATISETDLSCVVLEENRVGIDVKLCPHLTLVAQINFSKQLIHATDYMVNVFYSNDEEDYELNVENFTAFNFITNEPFVMELINGSDMNIFNVINTTAGTDPDGDGIDSSEDNCPNTFNPLQLDMDNDGPARYNPSYWTTGTNCLATAGLENYVRCNETCKTYSGNLGGGLDFATPATKEAFCQDGVEDFGFAGIKYLHGGDACDDDADGDWKLNVGGIDSNDADNYDLDPNSYTSFNFTEFLDQEGNPIELKGDYNGDGILDISQMGALGIQSYFALSRNPNNDHDNDGLNDELEIDLMNSSGLNAYSDDSDDDGIPDAVEYLFGTLTNDTNKLENYYSTIDRWDAWEDFRRWMWSLRNRCGNAKRNWWGHAVSSIRGNPQRRGQQQDACEDYSEDMTDDEVINFFGYNGTINITLYQELWVDEELNLSTNDTDGDGVTDIDEIEIYHTNPVDKDMDGDGLENNVDSNMTNPDRDGDGILDGDDPDDNDPDNDNDGIIDGFELLYELDITDTDTDNDGDNDDVDQILGSKSDVTLEVNGGSQSVAVELDGTDIDSVSDTGNTDIKLLNISYNDEIIFEVNYNFSINDTTIKVKLENSTIKLNELNETGSTVISGIPTFDTKTLYVDAIRGSNRVCVKDAEVTSVYDITSDCSADDETLFTNCDAVGQSMNSSLISVRQYNCTKVGSQYIITGLMHSAGIELGDTGLFIYDEIETSGTKYPGDDVIFYANYTNTTTGHISGAECNITFSDATGPFAMTDNGVNYNYTKISGFSYSMTYTFTVNCSKIGYAALNVTDDIYITSNSPVPEFNNTTMLLAVLVSVFGLVLIRNKFK